MRSAFTRAIVFAVTMQVMLIAVQLVVEGLAQMSSQVEFDEAFLAYGAIHAAILALTTLGAATGFLRHQRNLPSNRVCIVSGLVFTILSLLAFGLLMIAGQWIALVGWMLFGSAAMAWISSVKYGRNNTQEA